MLVLLPFACGVLILWLCQRTDPCWRRSALHAALACGMASVGISELLSAPGLLTAGWTAVAWAAIGAPIAALGLARRTRLPALPRLPKLPPASTAGLVCVALIAAALATIALTSAPNSPDAMEYHLPRVAHWIQNQTVAHYPTSSERQLRAGPGAEFAILQLQILSGGDRFAGLVQWLAMLGCMFGVTLIAQQLGGGHRAQVMALVVQATILEHCARQLDAFRATEADATLSLDERPEGAST